MFDWAFNQYNSIYIFAYYVAVMTALTSFIYRVKHEHMIWFIFFLVQLRTRKKRKNKSLAYSIDVSEIVIKW